MRQVREIRKDRKSKDRGTRKERKESVVRDVKGRRDEQKNGGAREIWRRGEGRMYVVRKRR